VSNEERATLSPVPAVGIWEFICLLAGRRHRFQVEGQSMAPTLMPGDTILVNPTAYRSTTPAIGDVVLCRHPFKKDVDMVKRVHSLSEAGQLHLRGDNPAETSDSDTFGAIPLVHLRGRVTGRGRAEST